MRVRKNSRGQLDPFFIHRLNDLGIPISSKFDYEQQPANNKKQHTALKDDYQHFQNN